jgi:hypothetical protein
MQVIFIFLSIVTLISNIVEAAFENSSLSVRAEGMGGAFTAIADDAGAIYYNPAGLAQITLQEISFLYTHPFNLSELEQNLINFVQPIKKGGRGFSYQQFVASNNYKEEVSIFGISTFANKNLCLGINFKQLYLKIGGYGQEAGLGVDAGGLYEISSKIKIGFAGFNINRPLIDVEKSYNLGLSIRPKVNLLIAVELEKSEKFTEISIGQEWWITNNFCIRAGLKKHTTTQPTLGLGVLINLTQLDYSCVFHPILGPTHLFSLTKWF